MCTDVSFLVVLKAVKLKETQIRGFVCVSCERRICMKDKIFGVLQRVGRSFMLPIAILPIAGLLLGLGSSFTNKTTIETYGLQWLLGDKTFLHALLVIMNQFEVPYLITYL